MALVECQRQQQEGAPASREPHSSSYVSHAAHRYERTCIESHGSQPRRHSAMERRWKKNISRWKRETSITTMRNGRTREIEAGEGTASCDETRRDERERTAPRAVLRATDRHWSRFYARTDRVARMRAAATSRVWMDGVERIVLDVLRRHPLSLLSRVNERKDTGWFYERIAIQGVSVRQRAPRTVHCARIYYEYQPGICTEYLLG